MACSLAAWRFLLGTLFALSLVLGAFHSAELKAAWSVFQRRAAEVAAENGISSSSLASWRMGGASSEAHADSPDLSIQALMRKLGVASKDAAWVRRYGVAEARDDASDEDAIDMELTEAQVSEKQWRLAASEKHLRLALGQADQWLRNLEDKKKPQEHRARAARKVIQVLTRLGRFLVDHGRSEEAAREMHRGVQLAESSDPTDKAVVAHAQASLANALCMAGGLEGAAVHEAKERFRSAVQTLQEALGSDSSGQAEAYASSHILEQLGADVHADFSECLHREGDLAAARSEAEAAQAIVSKALGGSVGEQLAERLVRIRGSILHDDGHFEDAMKLYTEYLERTETPPGGILPEFSQVVERFGVLQDFALATASMGRVDDALKSMDEVQRLQQAAVDEYQLKNRQKFLAKMPLDGPLQASLARSLVVRAELLLEQRRVAQQSTGPARPLKMVRGLAEKAVGMLREGGGLADRENAMNTLGNVYMSLRDTKLAQGTYEDSLKLAIKDHGMASPLVAAIYHNLAGALQARGSKAEALQLYRKALDIQMQTLGFGNPDTAGSLASLASCLELNGQHAEAAEVAARAAESARRAYPKGHWMQVEAQARLDKLSPAAVPASGFLVSTQNTEHIS
mmetsp:Transcript_28150/g.49087  ORF Transcript_28150/g.49087 Transcript_28150/m.49087 type:complete len:629 (-) Transcript_28150:182-2068(-)